jgi:hypothetical protein
MSDFWHVKRDPKAFQVLQDGYNNLVARTFRERAEAETLAKDAATRRAVEQAFVNGLTEMLRAYPDLLAATRLSPATVEVFAAQFANEVL